MKKLIATLLTLGLLVSLGTAVADTSRIFDRANLFSTAEENSLMQDIEDFQQKTGMDFVIVTSDEAHGDASQQQIADEFYERGGFGLDDEHSGVLYYIDMYERYHYISTTGKAIDYFDDDRREEAIASGGRYLTNGRYADGAAYMIGLMEQYIQAGIPEGQYRYDVVTGQVLTARHKALTSGEMLGCAILGLAVCLIFVTVVQRRYKLKGSTYSYSYEDNSTVRIREKEDTYLRTTTTQTRKPDPPRSGGGGGFGGGGTGVHTSSSGTSHGGGGGHF